MSFYIRQNKILVKDGIPRVLNSGEPIETARITAGARAITLGFNGNGTVANKMIGLGRLVCYPDIFFTALYTGTLKVTIDLIESNCFIDQQFCIAINNSFVYSPCSNVTNANLSFSIVSGQSFFLGYLQGDPYITNTSIWIE
jgi:hypothetical protein